MPLLSSLSNSGLSALAAIALFADVADSFTAAGSTQLTAAETGTGVVIVTTAPASSGVLLDLGSRGDSQLIYNGGANAVAVYPPLGHTINQASANTSLSVPVGSMSVFYRVTQTRWMGGVIPDQALGSGSSPTFASLTVNGLTTTNSLTVATGNLTVSAGQVLSAAGYGFPSETNAGLFLSGGFPVIQDGGTAVMLVGNNAGVGVLVAAGLPFSFGSSGAGSPDVFLIRDAAQTLAQRNGTNAQAFAIYNTFTSASVREYAEHTWVGSIYHIVTNTVGGTHRAMTIGTSGAVSLNIRTNGSNKWSFDSTGHLLANTDNTLDIGASGATRPRTGYFGTSVISPVLDSGAAATLALRTNTGTGQVDILHTASANRTITLTGSNGGNPTISTSAGNLGWGAALVSNANLRFSHGTSALATTATEGFFHIQSCAGAPTGVPATIPTGQIPTVYDSTNNRIYCYNGSWRSVAVA